MVKVSDPINRSELIQRMSLTPNLGFLQHSSGWFCQSSSWTMLYHHALASFEQSQCL